MKKMLYIQNGVFVLPDDFKGSITDAFTEFCKYFKENKKGIMVEEESQIDNVSYLQNNNKKFSGIAILRECVDDEWVDRVVVE